MVLFIYLFVCLFVCLFIYLSIYFGFAVLEDVLAYFCCFHIFSGF